MNADFRIATDFRNHPKRAKLARELGDVGVLPLIDLWGWVAVYRSEDGSLAELAAGDIAAAAGWRGDPDRFVGILEAHGWLDRDEAGALVVHEWPAHNGYASNARKRQAAARLANHHRWDRVGRVGAVGTRPNDAVGVRSEVRADIRSHHPPSPSLRKEEDMPMAPPPAPSPSRSRNAKPQAPTKKSGPIEAIPGYRETFATWDRLFQEANEGARPTFDAKSGALIKALLKVHGREELERRMENYLAHHRAGSFGAERFTLAGLRQRIDDWAVAPAGAKKAAGLFLAHLQVTVKDPWGPCPGCPEDDYTRCRCNAMHAPEVVAWRERTPEGRARWEAIRARLAAKGAAA